MALEHERWSMKEHAFSRSDGGTFPAMGNAIGKQEDGQ
jgi:hypothetical protein